MLIPRRVAAVTAALTMALSTFGVGAAGAEELQVTGTIAAPVTLAAEMPHCLTAAPTGSGPQGVSGYLIDGVTPGHSFSLKGAPGVGLSNDFDVAFFATAADCADGANPVARFENAGDEVGVVPSGATVALVFLWIGTPNASFVYTQAPTPVTPPVVEEQPIVEPGPREATVVAVIDFGFNPYHYDFVGSQHPWNVDADLDNDLDFRADPASYVSGYPGATPLDITLPEAGTDDVGELYEADADSWSAFEVSTLDDPKMYRFPGTKVIGALTFEEPNFYAGNDSHGTRSAASAAGNLHGTCPECLFVLVNNASPEALTWVAQQPWIDVVTNSYGHSTIGGVVRDNIYFGAPVDATREAAESGQTIVFSAGNGLANAFDVPMFTYWSSEKGPDWMVTVGAVEPNEEQTFSGAGKPVDISGYGLRYPSSGGNTADGEGTHSGTSNAAPTVAGTIARVIQQAREVLGDTTGGHGNGIVARAPMTDDGTAKDGKDKPSKDKDKKKAKDDKAKGSNEATSWCGPVNPDCPLADGVLTAVEARQIVFENVLPSPTAVPVSTYPWWPTTEAAYYYQGHGVVHGRMDADVWAQEQQRFRDALTGQAAAGLERPAGERTWMQVDSKCRQRLWGSWSGGYYDGVTEPAPMPHSAPIAFAFDSWCSQVEQDAFRNLG